MKDIDGNLASDEVLKLTVSTVMVNLRTRKRAWYPSLKEHLQRVHTATSSDLSNRAFLETLWEDDGISATGLGSVKVGAALDDEEFRDWFGKAFTQPLPDDPALIEGHLIRLYNDTEAWLRKKCDRVARLKLNRVLCTLFPMYFTTIADVGRLRFLHAKLGGSTRAHPVTAHLTIKRRFEKLLGPVNPDVPDADLDRLFLPWFLYEYETREAEAVAESGIEPQVAAPAMVDALHPQPAALRRKGLTAVKGYFGTILEMLPLLADGMTRQEFYDEIQRSFPDLGHYSVNGVINSIAREMNLCVFDGSLYRLNPRGLNLLDTRDPDEVADHLLTRVLGIDHAIKALETESLSMGELIKRIKIANPGWTSDVIPRAIISWLSSLGVIASSSNAQFLLTSRGLTWAGKIGWIPEALLSQSAGPETVPELHKTPFNAPHFNHVLGRLHEINTSQLLFPEHLVRQLHVGLWSHPVRHFAVLTGISGSGKTQLALNYAQSITTIDDKNADRVRVIPVQPAWYDPTPLLGYVSPLTQRYCSAPFLEILLRAADDPSQPYVVILDEMNLSHPEQYLAPLLSAMETRGWIDLHELPEDATEVPQRLQYPANVALIGTLNMDETTHGLSDKILDRAYTIEFWDIDVSGYPGWDKFELAPQLRDRSRDILIALGDALTPVRLHFAWRTIEDVLRYLATATGMGADENEALDSVIYARILPKLRGENTARFHTALGAAHAVLKAQNLKRCTGKVGSLISDLNETGTARFWR